MWGRGEGGMHIGTWQREERFNGEGRTGGMRGEDGYMEDIDRPQDRASVREGTMRGESLWEVRGREWGDKLVIRSGIQWAVGLPLF